MLPKNVSMVMPLKLQSRSASVGPYRGGLHESNYPPGRTGHDRDARNGGGASQDANKNTQLHHQAGSHGSDRNLLSDQQEELLGGSKPQDRSNLEANHWETHHRGDEDRALPKAG